MKKIRHPLLHWFHTNKYIGTVFILFGVIVILANLTMPLPAYSDPQRPSEFMNNLYFGLSRVSWLLSCFMVAFSMLAGKFGYGRAILGGQFVRMIGKSMIVACVTQIFFIELLFCSNNAPEGITLTDTTCLLFGLGFMFAPVLFGYFYMAFVEFPLTRLIQLTLLPHLSHDPLLAKHFDTKEQRKQ